MVSSVHAVKKCEEKDFSLITRFMAQIHMTKDRMKRENLQIYLIHILYVRELSEMKKKSKK
jgi:hypothetical protein